VKSISYQKFADRFLAYTHRGEYLQVRRNFIIEIDSSFQTIFVIFSLELYSLWLVCGQFVCFSTWLGVHWFIKTIWTFCVYLFIVNIIMILISIKFLLNFA